MRKILFGSLACFTMLSTALYAQGVPKLDLTIFEEKVNSSPAERSGAVKTEYHPADTIRYILTAANVGTGNMTEPFIVDPIPNGVTYLPGTAKGDNTLIEFSIDDGKTYSLWPVKITVLSNSGKMELQEVSPEMITHIRWKILIDIPQGKTHEMEFMVVVNSK